MNENIPALKIEAHEDGTMTLEQDWCGNIDRVTVHPLHLRCMAEAAGLIPSGNGCHPSARTLARRLRTLLHRINQLDEWLRETDRWGRVDLDMETTYSFATWELAHEFCADLGDGESERPPKTQPIPTANPDETHRVFAGSTQLELEAS